MRTFSAPAKAWIKDASVTLVRSIAEAHGLRAEVDFRDGYPMTVNDPRETAFVADAIADVFDGRFRPLANPMPGGEDFSRVPHEVPGAFIPLGAGDGATDNHSPVVRFDDALLADGATVLAELALRRLSR